MRTVLRTTLAILLGLVVGSVVNMALVMLGPALIPPPGGVDVADPAALATAMPQYQPRHFVMPFLAHALGTFAGALVAFLVAARHRAACAWAIGALFLAGGIAAAVMIPAPAWFIALDLAVAYLPMAWLARRLGTRLTASRATTAHA